MKDNLNHDDMDDAQPRDEAQLVRAQAMMADLRETLVSMLSEQHKSETARIMGEFNLIVWNRIVKWQQDEYGHSDTHMNTLLKYARTMQYIFEGLENFCEPRDPLSMMVNMFKEAGIDVETIGLSDFDE